MPKGIRVERITREQTVTRFWLSVTVGKPDECWPWTGYTEDGYGKFFDGERMRPAHELALEWYTGEPRPPGLETCHSCNFPPCCNPHHLRFDTRASNVADMVSAKRYNNPSKISDADVRLIRERAAAGATGRSLAAQYGLSEPHVTDILRGKKRREAGGPIRTHHGNRKHGAYVR